MGNSFRGSGGGAGGAAQRFRGLPDVNYAEDEHWVAGDRAVSPWLLTGTTSDGEAVRVRGCDLFDLDSDGRIQSKDSYWKIMQ